MWSSTGFSAAAWTRTSASPSRRRGFGTSAGAGGRPGASTTAARKVLQPDRIARWEAAVAGHGLASVRVELGVAVRLVVALERERPADGVVRLAGDHEVLRGEARDDLAAIRRHHELLLDARRRPAVAGRPE